MWRAAHDTLEPSGRVSAAVRVDGELRVTPTNFPSDATFPIHSITKTLTAICVLRLAEMGTLRLDDHARQWLPDVNIPPSINRHHRSAAMALGNP